MMVAEQSYFNTVNYYVGDGVNKISTEYWYNPRFLKKHDKTVSLMYQKLLYSQGWKIYPSKNTYGASFLTSKYRAHFALFSDVFGFELTIPQR
jgi:hypothetical protein